MTSLLVSGEDSPVKCGAILSPITDFELYGKQIVFFLCVCVCVCVCKQQRLRQEAFREQVRSWPPAVTSVSQKHLEMILSSHTHPPQHPIITAEGERYPAPPLELWKCIMGSLETAN